MEENISNFPLKVPHNLFLSATHPCGPLAGLLVRKIYLPTAHFSLVNTSTEVLVLTNLTVDPLERKTDGNSVETEFSIFHSKKGNALPEVVQIKPGEVVDLQLHISGNLLPGNYLTCLRITGRNTNQTLSIPIEVTILAHWLWTIGFMLLGLIFLGLIKFLAGVSDIQNEQKEILQLRQDVHEFLERYVPGDTEQKSVARIEEDLTRALEILNQPRRWTLKDDRLQFAQKRKTHIEYQFKALQTQLEGKSEGAAELEALEKEWENLTRCIAEAKALLSAQNETPNPGDDWSVLLQKFENVQRHSLLGLPIKAIEDNLGHQVERVRLALASGEIPRARELAPKVQSWLHQAAKILDERVHQVLTWRHFVSEMLLRQVSLSSILQDPSFPATERNELAVRLETARTALANTQFLVAFRQSYKKLQEAETFALKIWSTVIIAEVKDAMYAVERETSLALIGQALSKLPPGDAPEVKQQRVLDILELWHQRVTSCKSLTLRKTLLDLIDSLKQRVGQGDLAATMPGFKKLLELWTSYQDAQINKARRKVEKKFCEKLESELRTELYISEQGLALLEPNPRVKGVAEELDRVRLGLEQLPAVECLKKLTDLQGQLSKAGGKMITALIASQSISPEVRLSAAKRSGEKEAIALARRLMTGPRPIKLTSLTSPDELYVERQVAMELSDLDPSWGIGVNIIIDFGDGTPYAKFTAEQIRQGVRLTHRYKRPKQMIVHAIAAKDFIPGTLSPVGEMLGQGKAKLEILPSPIHAAQALADRFLNLRFILALAIGLLIQGWRFYGKHPFGIMNRDYLEAFALGVGIDASTRGLIEVLIKLGLSV